MSNLVQIILCIVVPLLILGKRRSWPERTMRVCMVFLPLIWYLTNAPLHELAHLLATPLVGGKIEGFRLVPHFWTGDFANAYIRSSGVVSPSQIFLTSIAPYFIDFLLLPLGYVWLVRQRKAAPFVFGLVFTLTCLRPLFNITNNLLGGLVLDFGDFRLLSQSAGPFVAYSCGAIFEIAALATMSAVIVGVHRSNTSQPQE